MAVRREDLVEPESMCGKEDYYDERDQTENKSKNETAGGVGPI